MATCGEDLESSFVSAASYLKTITGKLENDALLYFYARYKQAKEGPCNIPQPNFFDFTGKEKWKAWKGLGEMEQHHAMREYIERLNEIEPMWRSNIGNEESQVNNLSLGVAVSTLRQHEKEIEECDKTAFDWVKENNVEKLKRSCAQQQLEINETDDNGLSYLHWACDRGHLDVVTLLLENGALINIQDEDGLTPLHYACSCEHVSVVKELLQWGADTEIKDNDGCTPNEATSNTLINSLIKNKA